MISHFPAHAMCGSDTLARKICELREGVLYCTDISVAKKLLLYLETNSGWQGSAVRTVVAHLPRRSNPCQPVFLFSP
jgi:hypothetical protein